MKWYDDKFNETSTLILPSLYKVNEEIYDEIIELSDTELVYIKKCGITKYVDNHGYKNFVTNGEYIIYELPISEQTQEIIPKKELLSYSDNNTTLLYGNTNMEFNFELDRRYKEYRTDYSGKRFKIPTDDMNLIEGDSHHINIYEITADTDGVDSVTISDQIFDLPTTLNTGDRLVWQSVNKSYIYYPADETKDLKYFPCDCISMSTLAESTNDTLYSEGIIIEETHDVIVGNNEVEFKSINDKLIEHIEIGGGITSIGEEVLPDGYTELDYINSNIYGSKGNLKDTPYIITDYCPDYQKTTCESRFNILQYAGYVALYGGYDTSISSDSYSIIYSPDAFGVRIGDSGGADNTPYKMKQDVNYTLESGNGYIRLVDEDNNSDSLITTIPSTTKTGRITNPIGIFTRTKYGVVEDTRGGRFKLYYLRFFEDGVLVRSYIPCINPNGVVGLYEVVNKKFFPNSGVKGFDSGSNVYRTKYVGLGGDFGKPTTITLKHTVNNITDNILTNLNSPLLDGETIDLYGGIVHRKYRTIQNYNEESISTQWYSSNGRLEKGATIVYKVADYTESIPQISNISTNYDTHLFAIKDILGDMLVPIKISYNSTNYEEFSYKITFNNIDSKKINKFVINGSESGVGTHVIESGKDYYKLTLIIQDGNNLKNKLTFDVILDNIMYSGDTFVLDDESYLLNLYDKILNISGNTIIRFEENTKDFSMEYKLDSNINSNCKVLISVPYKEIREFTNPIVVSDMSIGSGNGFGKLNWDEVYGATEYQIMVNDALFASIDNYVETSNEYIFDSEIEGNMYIIASNDMDINSQSEVKSILSVPNSTVIENFEAMYETNKYSISFNFVNNSSICDYYLLKYTVDSKEPITIPIENSYTYGENISYTFEHKDISNNIVVELLPTNDAGSNNYTAAQEFIVIDDFSAWTYKKELSQILLCWYDALENEDSYLIKYRINRGEWSVLIIDKMPGTGNRMLEYIDMDDISVMDVCLTATINGKKQIYTKPIRISKALDTMLVPPINFEGHRIEYGTLEFGWKDNGYTADHTYELQITNVVTGKTTNIPIPENDTGIYSYIYSMDGYGYVNANVRMVWELGNSDYTNNVIVYNIPVTNVPPQNLSKQREVNKLKISWDFLNYVSEYTLYLTINGEESIHKQIDFEYNMDIPNDMQVLSINAKVQATFIDGSSTDISDSLVFNVCQNSYLYEATIYKNIEENLTVYTSIYSKGLVSAVDMFTVFTNHYNIENLFYEKSCRTFLEKLYTFYESTWGKDVGSSYNVKTVITNQIVIETELHSLMYQALNVDNTLETFIYRPSTTEYKLYSEFAKVVIVCLGDSITAGHPNYWAETGTGLINSQYEYWLDRRLKGQFDVVNAGYGQEKTNDMLARFDRSVLPYEPQYCIILGGTNDYVYKQ